MKQEFINLLASCNRANTDTVVGNLEKLGFFEAPASSSFHLSVSGGLCQHSVSVCRTALSLRESAIAQQPSLAESLSEESVKIAALLHDVCKAEIYITDTKNVKNPSTGVWEKQPFYKVDYSRCPMGHGEKSVIRLLRWGFPLTEDEMFAIRWHMGAWDLPFQSREESGNINAARERFPLVTILQCADMMSSALFENNESSLL